MGKHSGQSNKKSHSSSGSGSAPSSNSSASLPSNSKAHPHGSTPKSFAKCFADGLLNQGKGERYSDYETVEPKKALKYYTLASECFENAVKVAPDSSEALYHLAHNLLKQAEYIEDDDKKQEAALLKAAKVYDALIVLSGDSAEVLFNYGQLLTSKAEIHDGRDQKDSARKNYLLAADKYAKAAELQRKVIDIVKEKSHSHDSSCQDCLQAEDAEQLPELKLVEAESITKSQPFALSKLSKGKGKSLLQESNLGTTHESKEDEAIEKAALEEILSNEAEDHDHSETTNAFSNVQQQEHKHRESGLDGDVAKQDLMDTLQAWSGALVSAAVHCHSVSEADGIFARAETVIHELIALQSEKPSREALTQWSALLFEKAEKHAPSNGSDKARPFDERSACYLSAIQKLRQAIEVEIEAQTVAQYDKLSGTKTPFSILEDYPEMIAQLGEIYFAYADAIFSELSSMDASAVSDFKHSEESVLECSLESYTKFESLTMQTSQSGEQKSDYFARMGDLNLLMSRLAANTGKKHDLLTSAANCYAKSLKLKGMLLPNPDEDEKTADIVKTIDPLSGNTASKTSGNAATSKLSLSPADFKRVQELEMDEDTGTTIHNLACVWALLDHGAYVRALLELAKKLDIFDISAALTDNDLDKYRDSAWFKKLIN